MASNATRDGIQPKLPTFITDHQLSNCTLPTEYQDQDPLIIIYSQNIEIPRGHPKVKALEAVRKQTAKFQKSNTLLWADIQQCVLFQLKIHNSSLVGCTLIDCTIYGSSISYSHLKECHVLKNVFEKRYVPSMSCISNCQIENGTVLDTDISDSTCIGTSGLNLLDNTMTYEYLCSISQTCTLENSLLLKTHAFNSTLTNCGVHESELRRCDIMGGFLSESVVQSKNVSLRKLPVEIRKMIYSNAIANEGLATSLITALRSDSLLYGEVLETLFAEHMFVLEQRNHEAFRSMPKEITQRVSKLCLKAGRAQTWSKDDVSLCIPPGTRITDIQMDFQECVNVHDFYAVTKLWFRYFGTVRKFTVWTVLIKHELIDETEPPETLKHCIRVANKWLKREAVLIKDSKGRKWTWTWMAEQGSVLLWNS